MVALTADELRAGGFANVEVRVGDAEIMDFHDGSFDAITCGFGVHHFPNLDRALAQYWRVLRPSGRFVASTFADGTLDYPWMAEVIEDTGLLGPTRGSRGVPPMLQAPALRRRVRNAGFATVETITRQHRFVFADVDAYLLWVRTQGLGPRVNRLSAHDLDRFTMACARRLADYRAVDGYELVKSVDFTIAVHP
jgi:SAM-dependent methyltransferase